MPTGVEANSTRLTWSLPLVLERQHTLCPRHLMSRAAPLEGSSAQRLVLHVQDFALYCLVLRVGETNLHDAYDTLFLSYCYRGFRRNSASNRTDTKDMARGMNLCSEFVLWSFMLTTNQILTLDNRHVSINQPPIWLPTDQIDQAWTAEDNILNIMLFDAATEVPRLALLSHNRWAALHTWLFSWQHTLRYTRWWMTAKQQRRACKHWQYRNSHSTQFNTV